MEKSGVHCVALNMLQKVAENIDANIICVAIINLRLLNMMRLQHRKNFFA